jgi:enoyl-CoA hydratase/carnithine racemase
MFHAWSLAPNSSATVRRLAELDVATLALMHGPAFGGDCRAALLDLADDADKRIASAG